MSYGNFRSSTGDLHYYDDPPRRPERWDRDKFERYSRRSPEGRGSSYRFEERDRFSGGRGLHDVEYEESLERRAPRGRVMERERLYEEDRFSRRRPDFLNEPTPSEIASRALAPYRRKSIVERDFEPAGPVVRSRPLFTRRQSSLDTYDRKPHPRHHDHEREREREREEWRPPANVPIPLPIRQRSPSRPRRYAEDFEEIRYRELDPDYREEDYRDVHIHREKSRRRQSRSRRASSSKSSISSFEEVSPVREVGKKGKTRMPKRLVSKQAIIDLGYPFEEEEDFIVVKRALEKEQIDEVIKISESYKDNKVTYRYEEVREIEPLPPPPAPPVEAPAPPPPPPPPVEPVLEVPPPPPSVRSARSIRGESPARTVYEERIEESNAIAGPLTVLVPERRTEREIKAEIRALEAERRLVRLEREGDYEIIERREPRREVIRVEKDRKARRRRREPDSKIIGAMVATLT